MRQKTFWDRLAPGLLVLSFFAAPQLGSARAQDKVLIAYGGHSESVAHMWVGIDKGLFKKYGIDVGMLQVRSGPVIMATLASGSVNVIWTAPSSVLSAVAGGLKLGCIASTTNMLPRELVVRKEIKSLEEIRGKIFGVQSIGGGLWLQTMVVLEQLGIDPERYQLKLRVVGDIPTVTQALLSGNVDAAVLPYSFADMARRGGFHALGGQLVVPLQSNVLCTSRELIAKSPDLVSHLIRGMAEAVVLIHDPGYKEEVKGILKKNLRFSKAEDAEASYKLLRTMNTLDVAPHMESWRTIQRLVARVNPKVGQVNLDEVLDARPVQDLEAKGFLADMRKRLKQ